ncbi:hypothetical protein, partial [Nodularia sphaerocarpa]
ARTHLIIPEPSEDLITNEPAAIEFYADGLMEELFADIDEILDVSGNLPDHTLRHGSVTPRSIEQTSAGDWFDHAGESATPGASEYEHLQTINVPQIVLSHTLTHTGNTASQLRKEQVGTVVVNPPGAIITKHQKTRLNLGQLLIAGAAIAGTIYIVQSGFLTFLTSKLTQPDIYLPQTQLSTKVDVQGELVDYMLGALAIIDKQEKTVNRTSAAPELPNRGVSNSSPVAADLAPPLAANNTQPVTNRSTNVVERIYIPVYQAPSPMRYAPPPTPSAIAPQPQVANNSPISQPEAVKTETKAVQPPAKPANTNVVAAVRPALKPVPVQSAAITVKQPSAPQPGLPVPPVRPPSQPIDAQQQAYLQTSPATTATHTLAGLLELGDKSAALFEFEGVTRRINMGESIGASGWTLVDVANGEAIVRRNGEVRSIFAGQKL